MRVFPNYAIKQCLASQAGTGLTANTFLLLSHVLLFLLNRRPKPTDLIICHLAFVHIVMVLTMAFLMLTDIFGIQILQNDATCKTLFYLNRLMRGLSISTTCLLSTFQAITISPITSCLAKYKFTSMNHVVYSLFFLWFLNSLLCSDLVVSMVSSSNVSWLSDMPISEFCSVSLMSNPVRDLFLLLSLFRDIFFIGLMLLSSVYMVILLIKHQRRLQHLHGSSLSPKASPEQRATQTTLLLVSFFVTMYWVNLGISYSLILLWTTNNPVILGFQRLVLNGYTTISPLVLVQADQRIIKFYKLCWGRIVSQFPKY